MKIQLDLGYELNKQLKLYKIQNDLKSLKEAIIEVLEQKFVKKRRVELR